MSTTIREGRRVRVDGEDGTVMVGTVRRRPVDANPDVAWSLEDDAGRMWAMQGFVPGRTVTLLPDDPWELSDEWAAKVPRPEHVVKAEALRKAADRLDSWPSGEQGAFQTYLRQCADELDPQRPAEPTGFGAVVRWKAGWWVRVPDGRWYAYGWSGYRTWDEMPGPVEVLSEGVAAS